MRRRRDVGHHVLHRGRHIGGRRGRHGQPRPQYRGLAQAHCGVGRQLLVRRPVIPAQVQLVRAALGAALVIFVGPGRGGEGQERRVRRVSTAPAGLELLPRNHRPSSDRESHLVADTESLGGRGRHHRPRATDGRPRSR